MEIGTNNVAPSMEWTRKPESEKPRRRVGIADRKVFARLESFCAYLQNWLKINSKHSISLEGFQTVRKCFRTVRKVSRGSGKFPHSLESFWTIWRVSRQFGKFSEGLESFQTVWKVSGQAGIFLDNLEVF